MSVTSQLKRVRQLKTRIRMQRALSFVILGSGELPSEKLAQVREDDTVYIKRIVLTHI